MSKRVKILLGISVFIILTLTFIVFSEDRKKDKQVEVIASFFPLADFTNNLLEEGQVTNLVPDGVEPHDYEPTPSDIIALSKAKLVIYNGNGLEAWVKDFLKSSEGSEVNNLNISQYIDSIEIETHEDEDDDEHEELSEFDPHFWLDPVLASQISSIIADELIAIYPELEDGIKENFENYEYELGLLHQDYEEGLSTCEVNKIIVAHDAFNYLARRYNFEVIPVSGISPEAEPSPQKLAEITELAKNEEISYIFFESFVSPDLAETIANEIGANTLVLNPIETVTTQQRSDGEDYISLMRDNLTNLKIAMKCQ